VPLRIAIIGFGKIAVDEHVPALARDPRLELAAVAGGRNTPPPSVRRFKDHHELLRECAGELDAVAISTPPRPRYEIARDCLEAGLEVLLEKPPCGTVGEIENLAGLAQGLGRTLFTAWHSQFAPGVAPAVALIGHRPIAHIEIIWREDVRRWHPGQDWVFAPGGFGVFDPGINALSIVSKLAPEALLVEAAQIAVPEGRAGPIAASLSLSRGTAHLDWRAVDDEEHTIRLRLDDGGLIELTGGGAALSIDGANQPLASPGEYPSLYAHFAELIAERRSDVDVKPLRAVADAFLVASREATAPFSWSD